MIDFFARHAFFVTTLAMLASHAAAIAADPAPMMATEAAETIRLWPGDAPGARGTADHDIPVIAWWPAVKSPTPSAALVICPGGGYGVLADHEGSDYAKWLNSQGISAFVLRYRLGSKGYRHPVMLGDVSRAIRLVRHDHERLGIDPKRVGVMGSSAGGHLALTSCIYGGPGDATAPDAIDRESARPDLDNTPPLFVWHTWDDTAVKLEPILELGQRLKSLTRPFELHVYETGMHGLGLGVRPYDGMKQLHPWTVECRRWLGAQGF